VVGMRREREQWRAMRANEMDLARVYANVSLNAKGKYFKYEERSDV